MSGLGSATLAFGSTPTDFASVTVTGQSGIASGAACEAWFMASTTSDHGPDEHMLLAGESIPVCGSVVAGTGFTISIQTTSKWTGSFTVQWVWSN